MDKCVFKLVAEDGVTIYECGESAPMLLIGNGEQYMRLCVPHYEKMVEVALTYFDGDSRQPKFLKKNRIPA